MNWLFLIAALICMVLCYMLGYMIGFADGLKKYVDRRLKHERKRKGTSDVG